jgi:hypothetical protein
MKKLSCLMLGASFMFCIFAQSITWETLIPFESDDDGPVGIDITDTGEIIVAYYTNGPNESVWVEDSLAHSPVTKVARLNPTGIFNRIEDHGHLFNHNVTGIGRTEKGYSLLGNYLTSMFQYGTWQYPSSTLLIGFGESEIDTIEYKNDDLRHYKSRTIKTSTDYEPLVIISKIPFPGMAGGITEDFVIDLKDSLILNSGHVSIPDSIDFEKGSFYLNDIDITAEKGLFLTGRMISPEGYDDHLVYLISMDDKRNVLWENYNFVYSDVYRYYHSVSHTQGGGCIAGAYSAGNHLMKYDSEGIFEYSIGPYPGSLLYNHTEFIYHIGNNEYLFKIKGSDTVYKITDTGIELIEDWSLAIEGIKTVRAVENGFIAAGVKDGNIWIRGFDATTGIEDISGVPSVTTLYQNYPNPFNPVTQIRFALAKTADVKLSVYNIAGQIVAELVNGKKKSGFHTVFFNGEKLNSGVYYYILEVDGIAQSRRMLLIK